MSENTIPIEARAKAMERADRCFAKRDYEGFYKAVEDISKAAFDMGRAKGKYIPIFKEKPTRTPEAEPEPPKGGVWTVSEFPGELLRAKQGSTIYTVVRPGDDPTAIVAFCDNAENAALIARALSAYGGE